MSELDKTLKAIVDLCPENIPEIESLPIPELKIGDQCLLIWSDQIEVWRVKSFCANDGVDIVDDKFNAHMEVPRSELRLIGDFFNARQEEIDDLKNQLNNMEACYIGVKKQVKSCESLVGQWREKRMGGWSDYARGGLHSRQDCADDLEQALRGGHE